MENSDLLYLTSRSIEQCQPEHKQNHLQKFEKLKESKLNKIYSLLKLEAFKPKSKFSPLNFWNRSSIIPARSEKYSLALEDRLTKNDQKI